MASMGYVERDGFDKALEGCNPLAKFAAFDAIVKGGGNVAAPTQIEESVAKWREQGTDAFMSDVSSAVFGRFSAYGVLAGLLALVMDLIIESGINGFM
jgi:hypothetical protein